MKTLLLLRHGKTQPDAPQGDKKRHLLERGRKDAAEMGSRLPHIAGRLGSIVSSDAARTDETAQIAAAAAGYGGAITYEPAIYNATLDTLLSVVQHLSDTDDCVLMVGHNPGFEYLAADLVEEGTEPPQLPTASIAHFQFDTQHWRDVRPGTGTLKALYKPG